MFSDEQKAQLIVSPQRVNTKQFHLDRLFDSDVSCFSAQPKLRPITFSVTPNPLQHTTPPHQIRSAPEQHCTESRDCGSYQIASCAEVKPPAVIAATHAGHKQRVMSAVHACSERQYWQCSAVQCSAVQCSAVQCITCECRTGSKQTSYHVSV